MRPILFPTTTRGWLLVACLTLGAGLVQEYAASLGEPKRWILVLLTVGYFAAPRSSTALRLPGWLIVASLLAWAGRYIAMLEPSARIVLSFFGASVVVRAGERAVDYYLLDARETGARRALLVGLTLFLMVFVADGYLRNGLLHSGQAVRLARQILLVSSAASFIRFVLLQSRGPGHPAAPLWETGGKNHFVFDQRWPFLIFVALLGWSPLPAWILAWLGENSYRSLHLTAGLLMLIATAIFLTAILRAQRRRAWPRRLTRWASFFAGIFLAHALFAYLVDMGYRADPLGGGLFSDRAAEGIKSVHVFIATLFLIIVPFVHETTDLLRRRAGLSFFVAPPGLAIMNAPMAAINGDRWALTSTGFLFFVTLIMVARYAWKAVRTGQSGKLYLVAVLTLLAIGGYLDARLGGPVEMIYKLFVTSAGFILYALDLYERAGNA